MTLTLVDPSTAAVVQHTGGLISVRCADYAGPARAGLSTVADSLAAAGTAVKEEQTVAVDTGSSATGHSTRFGSVSDSVRIPLGDLDRLSGHRYLPFVSVRVEGEPPVTAHAKGSWLMWDVLNATNMGLAMGVVASYYATIDWLPSDRVANYILRDFRNESIFESETDLEDFVIRAWVPTGGSLAVFLETVYFVPVFDGSAEPGWAHEQYFPSDHGTLFFSNGFLWGDIDNDPNDLPEGFGKFSVLGWQSPWTPGSDGWGQLVDFQAADNEGTSDDVNGFGSTTPPTFKDPVSAFLHTPVGLTYVPQHTILVDDFTVEQHVHPSYGAHYTAKVGDYTRTLGLGVTSNVAAHWDAPSTSRRGTFVEAGDGFATTYFGDTSGSPGAGFDLPGGLKGYYGDIHYGVSEREGGFLLTETNQFDLLDRRIQPHLECGVMSIRVRVVGDSGGEGGALLGMKSLLSSSVGSDHKIGANLHISAAGDVSLSLEQYSTTFTPDWTAFASPVSVGSGYAPGDWWWIKVERKGYMWRAKAWEDGTAEPGSWAVEEFLPLFKGSTGSGYIAYPWDDNWPLSVNNDGVSLDPREIQNGFTLRGGPYAEFYWVSGQGRERISADDFTCEWDPAGSSPGDAHLRVEKYDGSVDYGTVAVPYGAHRFATVDFAPLLFDSDTHGWNMRTWRDSGNPDLAPVGLGRMFLRFPFAGRFIPFIYRRVHGG